LSFDSTTFRAAYVAAGGSSRSADSYVSYLNRADRIAGGVSERIDSVGAVELVLWLERQPEALFGGARNKRDSLSATRKYVQLRAFPRSSVENPTAEICIQSETQLDCAEASLARTAGRTLLAEVKALGARYYREMRRPLGVTGEVAELAAADLLGVELAKAREAGFDGWLNREGRSIRVQIKGRAVDPARRYVGRCPAIKVGNLFDVALLVLIDRATMEPLEIWEADEGDIARKLAHPGSRARNDRSSLGIAQFIGAGVSGAAAAKKVWPIGSDSKRSAMGAF
jgi:hypothetical protein